MLVEIDKVDQQLEFESRQANISIQSDIFQLMQVNQKPLDLEVVEEQKFQSNNTNASKNVLLAFTTNVNEHEPQSHEKRFEPNGVIESNEMKSQTAIFDEEQPTTQLETFPTTESPLNPAIQRLNRETKQKRKKTLDIDKIQSRSLSQSHKEQFRMDTFKRENSESGRAYSGSIYTDNRSSEISIFLGAMTPIDVESNIQTHQETQFPGAMTPNDIESNIQTHQADLAPTYVNQSEQHQSQEPGFYLESLGAQVKELKHSLAQLDHQNTNIIPVISAEDNDVADLSKAVVTSSENPSSEDTLGNVLAGKLAASVEHEDIPASQTIATEELAENPFTDPEYSFESPQPTVTYDDLITLSKRFNLPDLRNVAKTVTVDQVATMDVVEAERFGISRDSYFKLKRYFISRRKYAS